MTRTETLEQEAIICVNGEFYIFITQAKRQIDLHIESKEKFKTWKGTKDDLRKAAKEKHSNSEFGLDMLCRNNWGEIYIKEEGKVKYILTFKTESQIRLGINAPRKLGIVRDDMIKTR